MTHPGSIKSFLVLALVAALSLVTLCSGEERSHAAKPVDLSTLPTAVGNWKMTGTDGAAGSKESAFLNDVLFRTYRRADGRTLALAVAYGADQRKRFNLHLPETCYKASGYQVLSLTAQQMRLPELKLKEMLVQDLSSTQQIEYWMVLGGRQVTGELEKRAKHLYYSVFGIAAEGVLVRVSSFATPADAANERRVQQEFISALYQSLNREQKKLLFGSNA
jgi:EpsI family protein